MRFFPDRFTGAMVLASIVHSLERGLGRVAVRGTVPTGGGVLAANHGSWWDGFLLGVLAYNSGRRATIMMSVEQLQAYPFLAYVGAVPTTALDQMIAHARAGKLVVVFPEGALQAGRGLGPLHSGAARIAAAANVPLIPVGVRVRMRGKERAEAFMDIGRPVQASDLAHALGESLQELDALLDATDPEEPLPGYTQLPCLRNDHRLRKYASKALRALTSPTPRGTSHRSR